MCLSYTFDLSCYRSGLVHIFYFFFFFFFKQKTAYEIYQCDWSSDVCSSDLDSDLVPLELGRLLYENPATSYSFEFG